MDKTTVMFGLIGDAAETTRFLEGALGRRLEGVVVPPRRPRSALTEAKRALGLWAYQHPAAGAYPWRRAQAARQAAAWARRLAETR